MKNKFKLMISVILAIGLGLFLAPSPKKLTDSTVMITNYAKNSGGSGLILTSSVSESTVLTNAHVCEVVEKGGLVTTENGADHFISGFKKSKEHDLCLIYLRENLHFNTKVAEESPKKFDKIKIVGHPSLYPTIITEGHMSGRKIVNINMGIDKCDPSNDEDKQNPYCLLFGMKPKLKTFDTVVVSATIMPGSSGSGVYNSNDELIGLAFAGRGDLGYAIVVPYEYLRHFLDVEEKTQEVVKLN